MFQDEKAFGLALKTFESWFRKRSNLDILKAELDGKTVKNFSRLTRRIARKSPSLKGPAALLNTAVSLAEGKRIGDLLKSRPPKQSSRRKSK